MRIQVLLNEEAVAPRAVTFEQLTPQQIPFAQEDSWPYRFRNNGI